MNPRRNISSIENFLAYTCLDEELISNAIRRITNATFRGDRREEYIPGPGELREDGNNGRIKEMGEVMTNCTKLDNDVQE